MAILFILFSILRRKGNKKKWKEASLIDKRDKNADQPPLGQMNLKKRKKSKNEVEG
ncbi:MAG: hypothetical protein ACI30X_03025 [Muribaculaceae bacterium]